MKKSVINVTIIMIVIAMGILVRSAWAQDGIKVEEIDSDGIEVVDYDSDGLEENQLETQSTQSGVWGTCTWEIENYGSGPELTVHPGRGLSQVGKQQSPWKDLASTVTLIRFVEEGGRKVEVYGSTAYLFADLFKVMSIDLSGLQMHDVTDMRNMFENCANLTFLTLESFDTSKVTDMSCMFFGCGCLKTLDITNWNVSRVINMNRMFCKCSNLVSMDLSGWDVSNVVSMNRMFMGCTFITKLDVSTWNTKNVMDMAYLFARCLRLSDLDISSWDTSRVTDMTSMFSGCERLESIDLSSFDLRNVKSMEFMFLDCIGLRTVEVSALNTESVINLRGLFSGCRLLKSLDLSHWDTARVTDMGRMFYGCINLLSVNFDGWDTSQVTKMDCLFYQCAAMVTLDVSSWKTENVVEYGSMYTGCSSLDMFAVGNGYAIQGLGMLPNPTSIQGRWWSKAEHEWFSNAEVAQGRSNTADSYYSYDVDQSGTSISGASIVLDKTVYGWTGSEVKPSATVTLRETTLRQGIDYTVTYKNNINAGTGTVVVYGVGRYKDSASASFTISYAGRFRDVDANTYHVKDILWLANEGISSGWDVGDGVYEFRPSKPVARADMASFLFRLARKWGLVDDSWRAKYLDMVRFRDVSSSTTSHYMAIWWLANTGISEGWPVEGTIWYDFRPYASVTRQDMAAFLFRLAKLAGRGGASDTWSASTAAKKKFVDVDAASSTNHHVEVWWLAQTGVSEGWRVGNTYQFRGMQPVARQDMAAFLHRMDAL